jgi:hypothetical protein
MSTYWLTAYRRDHGRLCDESDLARTGARGVLEVERLRGEEVKSLYIIDS